VIGRIGRCGGQHVRGLDDQKAPRTCRCRQHREQPLRLGKVLDDQPRVHEIEGRFADGLRDDVVSSHFEVRPTREVIEVRGVDVEGYD
jgi:hypothetical protein